MRKIEPTLPEELDKIKYDPKKIFMTDPIFIDKYTKLVEFNAKLSYLNKDYLLFYRGQCRDYISKFNSSTFYPSIYRGGYISNSELKYSFDLLDNASNALKNIFNNRKIEGYKELKHKKYIQWSLLQHYQICKTPLLDFTHSLRVACSFAQCNNDYKYGFVFIFGLPYLTNRISINSEHDLVNIRLISISPPDALRPYYQEGYLAGTTDITNEYDQKTELDFRNRLIMKIKIPNDHSFWGKEFNRIPDRLLFPKNDQILSLCKSLEKSIKKDFRPGNVGDFIEEWSDLENLIEDIVSYIGDHNKRMFSFRKSIDILYKQNKIDKYICKILNELRAFRGVLIHKPKTISRENLFEKIRIIRQIRTELEKNKEHIIEKKDKKENG